uniref:hypothetical protein n=1 Tax=Chromobacterium amazonense TaxID=1382803 RepID=UPI003F78FF39
MNSEINLEDLYDEATCTASSKDKVNTIFKNRPAIKDVPAKLEELLNVLFPALLQTAIVCEKHKANLHRVDGHIIGTGEADFTKGNTFYTLNYKGKIFQLMDVPGIEGDETKYAHMVREAVAKAHLVFYVNGTNKKPEKATAEKIRSYLRHGTQVCPLVNVRGNADAYEFEEDREPLENHEGARTALKQTMDVLGSVLDKDVLLTGHSVQGLLAFSSLAINSVNGKTTIHPSREKDLVIQQRNYLKYFGSAKAMFELSQISAVAKVLHAKQATFKEDIVESNKVKVRALLVENIEVLSVTLNEHRNFIARVMPEFEKCRESIHGAVQTFERLITAGRRNLWSEFFNSMSERADAIVADNFGDNDRIAAKLKTAFQNHQQGMGPRLQAQVEEQVEVLQESMSQAMKRLIQDVRRIEFQQQIVFGESGQRANYYATELEMDLSLKDWGSIAFNVGSYALAGAGVGSVFPVIGNMIGAVAGAVVGLLVSALSLLTSKEKRIRKAQAQVQDKIDEMRGQAMSRLSD